MVSVVRSLADTLKDAQTPEKWLEGITKTLSEQQAKQIHYAYQLAQKAYGQSEQSLVRENLFNHALASATIVAELELLPNAIIATLLFAYPSFNQEWKKELSEHLPTESIDLIEGVNQLGKLAELTRAEDIIDPNQAAIQTESIRKMLLSMVKDIRVVLIQLALRTETMHFLKYVDDPELTQKIAKETLDIYAPLANRLGVWQIKWELEDLSFRYTNPEGYAKIAHLIDEKRIERLDYIAEVVNTLKEELVKFNIEADVVGRPKHIYSIYKKMTKKKLDFTGLYDIRAVRILVNTIPECYSALGVIHSIWQPIKGEFDDYIAHPKNNDYRSLHTAVIGPKNKALEVQIRTFNMHQDAEFGIAAHWRYKEGGKGDAAYEEKISWLRHLLDSGREHIGNDINETEEIADESDNTEDIASAFKTELFSDTIYALTPQGKVVPLPTGSTAIDFAYAVHSNLGARCRGAKVDGKIIPLSTPLENGQRVEIMTVKEGAPSVNWLYDGWVKSPKAISKIRQYIRKQNNDVAHDTGKQLFDKELARINFHPNIHNVVETLGFHQVNDVYMALGHGELATKTVNKTLLKIKAEQEQKQIEEAEHPEQTIVKRSKAPKNPNGILIDGVGDLMTTLAKCCKPAPPDKIIGFVTQGRGISVHRENCENLAQLAQKNPEKILCAKWAEENGGVNANVFPIDIELVSIDRNALLRDVSDTFSRNKLNVIAVKTLTKDSTAKMRFTVEVPQVNDLPRILTQLGQIKGVQSVRRI